MSRQVLTLLAKMPFVKSPLSRRFLVLLLASMSLALMGAASAFAAGEANPTGVTGSFNGEIGEGVDPSTGNVKRVVEDINVAGAVGAYPLKFSRTQNSRSGNPLGPFGPGGWWHSYQWGLWLRQVNVGGTTCHPPQPDPPYEGSEGQLFFPDGRIIQLTAETGRFDPVAGAEGGLLTVAKIDEQNWEARLKDGGTVHFFAPTVNNCGSFGLYPTKITDPYGQVTNLIYHPEGGRLWKVQEPGGRYLELTYTTGNVGGQTANLLSMVQAFDGRGTCTQTVNYQYASINYNYDPFPTGTYGPSDYLTQVDYDDGTHAYYSYQVPNRYVGLPGFGQPAYGLIKTCRDVRYGGAMKNIRYQFDTRDSTNPPIGLGQLKAELNYDTDPAISQIIYPPANANAQEYGTRHEQRADGRQREFHYDGGTGKLLSYTDFKGNPTTMTDSFRQVVTDARNNPTTIVYNNAWQIFSMEHPDHTVARYHYDQDIYLTSKTDENGASDGDPAHTTTYHRDDRHRIDLISYPDGGSESFTFDPWGQVLRHTMTNGATEIFTYDARGLKQTQVAPATASQPSATTQFIYYPAASGANTDRLQQMIDPRGNSTS